MEVLAILNETPFPRGSQLTWLDGQVVTKAQRAEVEADRANADCEVRDRD